VSGVKRLAQGIEVGLFCDRDGRPRGNPFHASNVSRPEVSPYGKAYPLGLEQCQAMWLAATGGVDDPMDERDRAGIMDRLQGQALVRQRDRALLKFALYTGRRASEIARLKWGDIDAGPSAGSWILRWKGKGGKSSVQALPPHVYWEIVCWMKAIGRWPAAPGDFVWAPIRTEQIKNLGLEVGEETNRHISADQINKVVKKLARRAGLPEGMVHTHTLRHTFAHLMLEHVGDVNLLQKTLGHQSLATTTIYANSPARQKPVDKYGPIFQQKLGF
jgi:integrase